MADLLSGIPQNPADWTYDHARSAIPATNLPKPSDSVGDGLLYVQGDHYQGGKPWVGPPAAPGDTDSIQKSLVPVPESLARVNTRVNGACGHEADISIEPQRPEDADEGKPVASEAQTGYAEEWRRDLSAWWDDNELWGGKDIRRPTGVRGMVAYASATEPGSACIRVFFNPAALVESPDGEKRIPPQPNRRAALRHLKVVAPPPDRCAVYTDPDTHEKTGVFLYQDRENRSCAEVWYAVERNGKRFTVLRQLTEGVEQAEPKEYPWNGLLPIQQADIGTLLTEPIRRLQASIDFESSALKRNTEAHGYGQRTEINAEEDGLWLTTPPPGITNPRTRVNQGITEYFNPVVDSTLGAKTIRRLFGAVFTISVDKDGKETVGLTTPTVHYHDPSPPEAIISTLNAHIMLLREGCHQGHITSGLQGSTAEASGDAYEQKRADFQQDIDGVAETVDQTLIPFLTVVTVMADYLTGVQDARFAQDWTVHVQSHPSAGPVSTERQTTTIALKQAKIISGEEATGRVGVQDVGVERDRIAREQDVKSVAETAKALIDAGADRVAAWTEAGFDEETANRLARTDSPFVEQ